MLLYPSYIDRLSRSHGHELAVNLDILFELYGINTVNGLRQGALAPKQSHLFGLVEKLIAKPRVGDTDHGHGPLLDALSEQVHDTVFTDDILDVASWHHNGRIRKHRDNTALFILQNRGWHNHDRLSALRPDGASHEVQHTRDTGEVVVGKGIGCNLPGEIDRCRNAYGYHPIVAGDDTRVIHIVRRMELNARIVVDKLVQVCRTHGTSCNKLPLVEALLPIRNDAHGNKAHKTAGHGLRMNAQIVLPG